MRYLNRLNCLAEKEYIKSKLGLARIKSVLDGFGNPQNSYPVIHVSGTNGKGSTVAILQSMLKAHGLRVGLYTSPHFISCRERIRVNNDLITERDLDKILKIIFDFLGKKITLTYFEILTVAAFIYFYGERIDVLISEVGLGGRLDATNVVANKIASIITSVDFDHTDFLGSTLKGIAREKAGIIKRGIPLITYTGHLVADKVIREIGVSKKCPIFILNRDFHVENYQIDWKQRVAFFSYRGIYRDYFRLSLQLLGEHQARNASLALACIELLQKTDFGKGKIKLKIATKGLAQAFWPGRFEIITREINEIKRTIILDGAHNVSSIETLIKTLSIAPFSKVGIVFILSILKDKNYFKMAELLLSIGKKIVIFEARSSRALKKEYLLKIFIQKRRRIKSSKAAIVVINDLTTLEQVLQQDDRIICVTGSLFSVAAVKKAFSLINRQ